MGKGRLTVLVVLALVLGSIQCAAFCAVERCTGGTVSTANAAPCHQHPNAPSRPAPESAPCGHRTIGQADTTQAAVTPVFNAATSAADLPFGSFYERPLLPDIETAAARAPSPPGLAILFSGVLRI